MSISRGLRLLAAVATVAGALFVAPGIAAASSTYQINQDYKDTLGRVTAHFSGWLRYDNSDSYYAHICIADRFGDGRGAYFKFVYKFTGGGSYTTPQWRNDNSVGSTVCHDAWVHWPPALDGITMVYGTDRVTPLQLWLDNPYSGTSSSGQTPPSSGHTPTPPTNTSPTPTPAPPRETFGPKPKQTLMSIRPRYVAMGDSYSSGQGAGSYYPPAPDRPAACWRSHNAYSVLLAKRLRGRYASFDETNDFVACAGAKVSDLLDHQVKYLAPDVGLITVGVSGDDAGWTDVLRQCMGSLAVVLNCKSTINRRVKQALPALTKSLGPAFAKIRDAAPHATVIVVGYPKLFDEKSSTLLPPGILNLCITCSDPTTPVCTSVVDLTRGARVNFNNATGRLDDLIKRIARQHHFRFVDPRPAFQDHAVCGPKGDWIGGLPISQLPDTLRGHPPITVFHPNRSGQAGYADAIAAQNRDIFR